MSRVPPVILFAALLTGVSGCAVGNARLDSPFMVEKPKQQDAGTRVRVEGVLTGDGVECQAMRSDDGTLYTLSSRPAGFKVGDRVLVTGDIAKISFCMQGITLNVVRMENARR